MKKLLIIDRDGTIIKEPKDYQIDDVSKLDFLPGVLSALSQITQTMDYELVMVTNQDGLGTKLFPEPTFWPVHELMLRILASEGIEFDAVHIDRSFPEDRSEYRKPGLGMVKPYLKDKYDIENSFVIGDRWSDMKLAENMGCQGIMIGDGTIEKSIDNPKIALKVENWHEIVNHLKTTNRIGKVFRATKETRINVHLDLDSTEESNISTGLNFFDHMLDQVSRHGQVKMDILAEGDLQIDEHHTIEDTAIAMGQAFKEALGKKAGIERYGFALPMDDVAAQVLLDFGGRPWIEWDVEFKREKIGDVPTEMFYHFFKSFSDHAKCNLHIRAYGTNEHHLIEGIFKSFAKAIKMANKRTLNDFSIPSTKGII